MHTNSSTASGSRDRNTVDCSGDTIPYGYSNTHCHTNVYTHCHTNVYTHCHTNAYTAFAALHSRNRILFRRQTRNSERCSYKSFRRPTCR